MAAALFVAGGTNLWAQSEPTQDGEGYYLLGTADDVEWFASQVNSGTTDLNAKLTADVTFDAETNYATIGNSTNPYSGTFDGQGHRIINRNVDTGANNGAGFFGYIQGGAHVKNLILDATCSFKGNHVIGAFAGAMTGASGTYVTFENCVNEASVTATAATGCAAAFVGAAQGASPNNAVGLNVSNSYNKGAITASGRTLVFCGYVVSTTTCTITNCYNTGTLSTLNSNKENFIQSGKPTFTNCYELSGVEGAKQGIIADAGIVSTGELCYLLNGDQSDVQWYQIVGSGEPVPFTVAGGQVFAHGSQYCDGTPAGAATVYNNEGPDGFINLGHDYVNGICSRDCAEKYQAAEKDGDYYVIANAGNLEWFSQNQQKAPSTYTNLKLTADIDMTGVKHQPIGQTSGDKYRGIFDGQGHRITNLTEFTRAERVGIIGASRGVSTTVRNLIIDKSCKFTGTNYVSAFVADIEYPNSDQGYTTFENCINEADIEATGQQVGAFVGGAATNDGAAKIVNCINLGSVTGGSYTGALVGKTAGTGVIIASYNEGKVLGGRNGNNNLVATGNVTYNGACDLSGMADATQGIILTADDKANGALCYNLNGDQSTIRWTQTVGSDALPVLGTEHSQVYVHGQVYCDGSPAPGTLYDNAGPDGVVNIGHEYVNGICQHNCDAKYVEPAVDGEGWYLLANAGNVEWFARSIQGNASYGGKNIKLTADIDFTGVQHTPIGWDGGHKFAGQFDGQGHKISNMTSFVRENKIGFFGEIRGTASVKNVTIDETCAVTGTTFVAGLVGCANVGNPAVLTLENCINKANVTSASGYAVGGLVGGTEYDDIGGLTFQNCANTGDISANDNRVGTLAGDIRSRAVVINNTYNSGALLNGQNGSNNLVATCGSLTCNAACDASSIVNREQGLLLAPADVAGGALTYWLNGDQSDIKWTQTIGTDVAPVLGTTSSQVFIHGEVYCDKTLAAGSAFSNAGPDELVQLDHNYTNGICSRNCEAHFQPATLDGEYYLLSNAGNIEWFSKTINDGPDRNLKAKLTNDIDMNGVAHTPIGTYSTDNPKTPFTGTFDGQGHVIRDLYVYTTDKREAGFFSRTDAATVQNIGFENATIESAQNIRAGVLGGEVYRSTAINIYVCNATVTTTGQKGGLAGEAAGTTCFTNCWTTFDTFGVTLNAPANSYAAVTVEQMESGELAYNLNAGAGETLYFQTIGVEAHPTFSGDEVYKTSDAGWGTFFDTTENYAFNGVKAYTAKINGEYLALTEVSQANAGTPVILEGTYYNKVVKATPAEMPENDLKGTSSDLTADGTQYVLAKPAEAEVGFYQAVDGTIPAGKAYILYAGGGVKGFTFGTATSIASPLGETEEVAPVIYDLSGRRVEKATKGIYIINGKKVLK